MDPILAAAQSAITARNGLTPHQMAQMPGDVHVDRPLTEVSIRYRNRNMIADAVMPIVQVKKLSDRYWVYAASLAFDTAKTDVSSNPTGQVSQVSPRQSPENYSCTGHALRDVVPAETQDNADSPLDPLIDSTETLTEFLMLAREVRVASKAFNSANYGSNHDALSGSDRWDTATGTPIADLQAAIEACVVPVNTLVIGGQAWRRLMVNPEVKSYFANRPAAGGEATPVSATTQFLATVLGIDKVVVGDARYNSVTQPGTPSYGWVWGKSAALIYVNPKPSIRSQAWGVTFRMGTMETRQWWEPGYGRRGATVVQVDHADDERVVESNGLTGYLFETVIS